MRRGSVKRNKGERVGCNETGGGGVAGKRRKHKGCEEEKGKDEIKKGGRAQMNRKGERG